MLFTVSLFILILLGLIQVKAFKKKLDLIDLLILINVFYFGFWPLIKILSNFNKYSDQEYIVIISVIITFMALLLIWIINFILISSLKFPKYNRFVNLETLIYRSKNISNSKVYCLIGLIILFICNAYLNYGITKSFSFDGIQQLGIELPFWFLAVFSSIRFLILFLTIILAIKYFLYKQKLILYSLILVVSLSLIYGKANLIMNIIPVFFLYLSINKLKLFNKWIIITSIPIIFLTFISINFFQEIRSGLLNPSAYVDSDMGSATLSVKASNITTDKLTSSNKILQILEKRPTVIDFNIMILDWQISKDKYSKVSYGELLAYSLSMMVPRYFWKSKPENNLQKILLFPSYNETYTEFQAPSILGYAIADFGLLAIIMYPLFIFILLFTTMFIANIFYKYKLSYSLIVTGIIYNILSVEANYDSYILILRNSAFFAVFFLIFSISFKGVLYTKRNS